MIEVGNNEQRRLRQAHVGHDPSGEEIHVTISGYLRVTSFSIGYTS
jgi:hypothetical protein